MLFQLEKYNSTQQQLSKPNKKLQKVQKIAKKLVIAFEAVEKLSNNHSEGHFYLSHLDTLSRLQKDIFGEIFTNLGYMEPVHSGIRSPYCLTVSLDEWRSVCDTMITWIKLIGGLIVLPRSDNETQAKQASLLSSVSLELIQYWSRLFGQVKTSVEVKGFITMILALNHPVGLTKIDLAEKVAVSERTISDYLNQGFEQGWYSRCFPNGPQTIGYRLNNVGLEVLKVWESLPSLKLPDLASTASTVACTS